MAGGPAACSLRFSLVKMSGGGSQPSPWGLQLCLQLGRDLRVAAAHATLIPAIRIHSDWETNFEYP